MADTSLAFGGGDQARKHARDLERRREDIHRLLWPEALQASYRRLAGIADVRLKSLLRRGVR